MSVFAFIEIAEFHSVEPRAYAVWFCQRHLGIVVRNEQRGWDAYAADDDESEKDAMPTLRQAAVYLAEVNGVRLRSIETDLAAA